MIFCCSILISERNKEFTEDMAEVYAFLQEFMRMQKFA